MKKLLYFLLAVIGIIILIVGYFGFIPGLSNALGSTQARNLGTPSTTTAFTSFSTKSGISFEPLESGTGESIAFKGSKAVDASFTPEEITSTFANVPWKDFPLFDVQIRTNTDGSLDLAGVVDTKKIPAYLAAHGLLTSTAQTYLKKVESFGFSLPLHIKTTASFTNNKLTSHTTVFEIGRYKVEPKVIERYEPAARAAIEKLVSVMPGLSIESMAVSNGAIHARGTFPAVIQTARE